ncbi:PREDICTED: probable protein phosphatase 2C 24 [Ipomoea nil]|uniref:probable protein phosphatase 2C 24 n=1 Tax=Ipomoea nil TaxID=35883 RepID=UPI00090194AF|nr:PREDICTED: probable protein phosphatase 2C 24 [Ipomoea nil]
MAEICCGLVNKSEASPPCESSSRSARRRRLEIRRIKFVPGVTPAEAENGLKRPRFELCSTSTGSVSRLCDNAVDSCDGSEGEVAVESGHTAEAKDFSRKFLLPPVLSPAGSSLLFELVRLPKYGMASVCGRRRDMEDAVAVHPWFCRMDRENNNELHYFAVYDGHGCSHVAMKCKERLHELVKEELEKKETSADWKQAMEQSFSRMDKEVIAWNESVVRGSCRCELQTPECDAVGSTAVVAIVTPDKIIVANCGDSRAVLCRNGKAIPLSNDHKPDRPDELNRIQEAGGRVIYWEGPRVLGVLSMSRAIGDNYLKPYVICEPEVTITDRTPEDDCIILGSDGLWDVVSNDTACGVARMCLNGKKRRSSSPEKDVGIDNSDKVCSDASMLLTKLALARRSSDNVSVVVVDLKKAT